MAESLHDENRRRAMTALLNSAPATREELEEACGKDNVWDTSELTKAFSVMSFGAPYCIVVRKSDGLEGSVMFQHDPRFYFNFVGTD